MVFHRVQNEMKRRLCFFGNHQILQICTTP